MAETTVAEHVSSALSSALEFVNELPTPQLKWCVLCGSPLELGRTLATNGSTITGDICPNCNHMENPVVKSTEVNQNVTGGV